MTSPAAREETARRSDPVPEEADRPERDSRVQEAEENRRAREPEAREEDERKEDRSREGAEVVEREDLRHEVPEDDGVLEQPHEEGDLEADERPDPDDDSVEDGREPARGGEGEEEHRRGQPAEKRHADLRLHESPRDAAYDEPGKKSAEAESREVHPDDERELRDRVAEEVARESTRHELVDEAARRDGEDREVNGPRPEGGRRLGAGASLAVAHAVSLP